MAYDISAKDLTAEMKKVKEQFVKVAVKKLELSTRLTAVERESDKMLEELAVVLGGRDHVYELVRSIMGQPFGLWMRLSIKFGLSQ